MGPWAHGPGPEPGPGPKIWRRALEPGPGGAPALIFGPGPGPCCRHLPMSLARAHNMGLDSSGKGIYYGGKKIQFGAESGPLRSSGRFQRAFRVIFRCGSDGTILGSPISIFFCFTTEARPYLIGRCPNNYDCSGFRCWFAHRCLDAP